MMIEKNLILHCQYIFNLWKKSLVISFVMSRGWPVGHQNVNVLSQAVSQKPLDIHQWNFRIILPTKILRFPYFWNSVIYSMEKNMAAIAMLKVLYKLYKSGQNFFVVRLSAFIFFLCLCIRHCRLSCIRMMSMLPWAEIYFNSTSSFKWINIIYNFWNPVQWMVGLLINYTQQTRKKTEFDS